MHITMNHSQHKVCSHNFHLREKHLPITTTQQNPPSYGIPSTFHQLTSTSTFTMNFSKLAFAILLGSASVGTAQKAGKATTSIDVFDCEEYITTSYWAVTTDVDFPDGTSSCPRPTVDTPVERLFFNCADNTIRLLNPNVAFGSETCITLTAFDATADLVANVNDLVQLPAARTRLLGECQRCPVRTGKAGKAR